MSLPPIVYRGSVKDIRGVENSPYFIFEYSDRYSIFDWGEMPDRLEDKGKALTFMAEALFSLLERPHHGQGAVDQNLSSVELLSPDRYYKVKRVNVLRPSSKSEAGRLHWDYSAYKSNPKNALVPLEMIFRFGVPAGSSILKRAKNEDYMSDLGVTRQFKEGDMFDSPIIECSTKLESSDRYIDYNAAKEMANLSEEEFARLKTATVNSAIKLKEIFDSIGVVLWDGKFEFAFSDVAPIDGGSGREFMLVDSIGPDELRLTCQGVQLSKENLRGFYRGSDWHKAVERAKKMAGERGEADWKSICLNELKEAPAPLTPEMAANASMIYKSLANEIAKKYFFGEVFPGVCSVKELIERIKI